MRYTVPLGRVLYAFIFLNGARFCFTATAVAFAAQQGVPLPNVAVPLAGVIALLGGASVLLGYQAKIGAWLLVLFLVPVTLMMHNFWAVKDPLTASMQQANFFKNAALLGAALLIAHFGPGPLSLDARRSLASQ